MIRRMFADEEQLSSTWDSGKRPLGYSLYSALCFRSRQLLVGGFAHLCLVLSWNLMCRSRSTQTIRLDHLSFEEDALGVVFYKSKTDQGGMKRRDPKHIYANPMEPTTCVMLALAVCLSCNPTLVNGFLFPGSNQRDRFGKTLQRLVGVINDSGGEMISINEIGTHSIRKGAAPFACSGSTSGPSIVSVCIRCGWSIGHVLKRYMHYEKAGDQFLGRVIAGLPLNSSKFACLPPHFDIICPPVVDDCLRLMFPSLVHLPALTSVLKLCLASLVYHSQYLLN